MIKTNLAVLMAQRGLKIADVHQATGISKTTLMALAENEGKGVQFDTIDKLCLFLGVSIDKFLLHVPYMFSFEIDNKNPMIKVIMKEQGQVTSYEISGECMTGENMDDLCIHYHLHDKIDYYFEYSLIHAYRLMSVFNSLPIELKTDFFKDLEKCVDKLIELYKSKFTTTKDKHLTDENSFYFYIDELEFSKYKK